MPEPKDFVEIECHDIGPGGFSYIVDNEPPSDLLVVALGKRPNLTHLTAKIVHSRQIYHRGTPMYIIGCCYTGRISY